MDRRHILEGSRFREASWRRGLEFTLSPPLARPTSDCSSPISRQFRVLQLRFLTRLITRDVEFWIAERFVARHKYAANLITLSRLEGPLSSSENTLLHCRQFINGRAQPIHCTSNTLLKIINKQQAHKAPIKCRTRIFDLPNAISAPHNTLIQLPTARHNNAAHLIAPRSHTNFPFVSRAAFPAPLARTLFTRAPNRNVTESRLMRSIAYRMGLLPLGKVKLELI